MGLSGTLFSYLCSGNFFNFFSVLLLFRSTKSSNIEKHDLSKIWGNNIFEYLLIMVDLNSPSFTINFTVVLKCQNYGILSEIEMFQNFLTFIVSLFGICENIHLLSMIFLEQGFKTILLSWFKDFGIIWKKFLTNFIHTFSAHHFDSPRNLLAFALNPEYWLKQRFFEFNESRNCHKLLILEYLYESFSYLTF